MRKRLIARTCQTKTNVRKALDTYTLCLRRVCLCALIEPMPSHTLLRRHILSVYFKRFGDGSSDAVVQNLFQTATATWSYVLYGIKKKVKKTRRISLLESISDVRVCRRAASTYRMGNATPPARCGGKLFPFFVRQKTFEIRVGETRSPRPSSRPVVREERGPPSRADGGVLVFRKSFSRGGRGSVGFAPRPLTGISGRETYMKHDSIYRGKENGENAARAKPVHARTRR